MEKQQMRVDLYADIHKGLRYELFGRLSDLGRLDLGDGEAVQAYAAAFAGTCSLLTDHAGHEDRCMHPLLEAQYKELVQELESEHVDLERQMTAAQRAVEELSTVSAEERPVAAAKAYRAFSHFIGGYLVHMGREEREVMAALWGLYDDARLMEVQNEIRGSIAPPRMAQFLKCMIPAMNVDERTMMLSGMKANAPPEVFAGVCGLAESLLSEPEWGALRERVGM